MSALDDVNVARLVNATRRTISAELEAVKDLSVPDCMEYVEAMAAKLKAAFPQVVPCEVGPAQLIHSFRVGKGRRPIQFFDIEGKPVSIRQPSSRGLRKQRRWAKSKLGVMLCDITFQSLLPVNTISLNFTIAPT